MSSWWWKSVYSYQYSSDLGLISLARVQRCYLRMLQVHCYSNIRTTSVRGQRGEHETGHKWDALPSLHLRQAICLWWAAWRRPQPAGIGERTSVGVRSGSGASFSIGLVGPKPYTNVHLSPTNISLSPTNLFICLFSIEQPQATEPSYRCSQSRYLTHTHT